MDFTDLAYISQSFHKMCRWGNRSIFGKDMEKSLQLTFLAIL